MKATLGPLPSSSKTNHPCCGCFPHAVGMPSSLLLSTISCTKEGVSSSVSNFPSDLRGKAKLSSSDINFSAGNFGMSWAPSFFHRIALSINEFVLLIQKRHFHGRANTIIQYHDAMILHLDPFSDGQLHPNVMTSSF
jgi:hypothetical protein